MVVQMEILYKSTRGNNETVTASKAILQGLSADGGLLFRTQIPSLDMDMETLAKNDVSGSSV